MQSQELEVGSDSRVDGVLWLRVFLGDPLFVLLAVSVSDDLQGDTPVSGVLLKNIGDGQVALVVTQVASVSSSMSVSFQVKTDSYVPSGVTIPVLSKTAAPVFLSMGDTMASSKPDI